jgi:PKD repeat protein
MDSCFYTSTQEVWIQNMPGCNAYFTYYPDSVDQKTIYFLDLSYEPNGLPPTSWLWEFGDGTGSTLQNPMHTYADTGYYTVCLTIFTGVDSCTSTYCEEIYTGIITPPGGCESFILYMNMVDLTVDFEGYTVSQYETDYTWDFGDGASGTGQFITHTFPAAGMYNITLQTIDATGCIYRTFSQIWLDSLNQGNCSAYFSYEPVDSTTFTFSGVVYFNNGMIYPDSSTVFSWDFGDGTTGTGQTITHYFQENPAGGYNVCLTATAVLPDGTTCTSVYCEFVYTSAPSFNIFGYVYLANNTVADQAEVHLMTMDTTWQGVTEVQTVMVDSGGFYNFAGIPLYNTRLYYVQAELTEGSAYYGEYLPTYHISALNWEQANPVLPLNNWTADIYMIAGTTMDAGPGEINGVVSDLGTRGFMEGVEVVLLNEESNPLVYSRSDSQGGFSFTGLPMGTYIVHAEMMGIHTIQAEVTLSEQNPGATVEVQVSGGEAYVVYGIPEQPVSLESVSDIYPNPVSENSRFDLTLKSTSTVEISIVNLTGQKLAAEALKLDKGTHSYNLKTSALPEGIYLIRIRSEQGDEVIRKFMKSR